MFTAGERRTTRWVVVWVACLLLAAVGLLQLTDNVVDHDGLTAVDLPWHEWAVAHRSPAWTGIMSVLSFVGSTFMLVVYASCAVGWLAARRQRVHAVLVVVTTLGAAVLVPLLKHVFARERPPVADRLSVETSWSYPSGHSLGSTAVLGVIADLPLPLPPVAWPMARLVASRLSRQPLDPLPCPVNRRTGESQTPNGAVVS